MLLLLLLLVVAPALAIDNGVGLTPPMGWRHWKAFYADISQDIMENMMAEMTKEYPDGDGGTVSLKELGYLYVGLDDHWQNCTRTCANGTTIPSWYMNNDFDYKGCENKYNNGTNNSGSTVLPWYTETGVPVVDTHRFPDLKGMVSKAHGMGLRAGWYFGNYQCRDANHRNNSETPWNMTMLVAASVKATVEYGFDSVKLDSGFPVGYNVSQWAEMFNATGRPVMIENCHQGGEGPGMTQNAQVNNNCTGLTPTSDCPYNFWRTTGDPEPGWGTIMRELNTLRAVQNPLYPDSAAKYHPHPSYNADPPRSRPGGFAYPGTMVVGDGDMTKDENAVHFGGWCIVSSPLILAFNMSDSDRHELVWDIITNKEAIQINQAWAGHPGSQVMHSLGNNSAVEVWTKPLGDGRTAAFIINTEDKPSNLSNSGGIVHSSNGEYRGYAVEEQGLEEDDEQGRLHFYARAAATATAKHSPAQAPAPPAPAPAHPIIRMNACNSTSESQRWKLDPGVVPGNGKPTTLMTFAAGSNGASAGPVECAEIDGCSEKENSRLGVGECKKLPSAGCTSKPCDCNGAFAFNKNGSITSVMDGKCLQWSWTWMSMFSCVDADGGGSNSGTSGDSSNSGVSGNGGPHPGPVAAQTYNTTVSADGSYVTIEQGGLCFDYAPPAPPGPRPPSPSPSPHPPGPRPPPPPAPVATVTINLADLNLGISGDTNVKVRDVWAKKDLPKSLASTGKIVVSVPHHGSVFFVFMPENSTWPLPFKLAPWMDKPAPPVPPAAAATVA